MSQQLSGETHNNSTATIDINVDACDIKETIYNKKNQTLVEINEDQHPRVGDVVWLGPHPDILPKDITRRMKDGHYTLNGLMYSENTPMVGRISNEYFKVGREHVGDYAEQDYFKLMGGLELNAEDNQVRTDGYIASQFMKKGHKVSGFSLLWLEKEQADSRFTMVALLVYQNRTIMAGGYLNVRGELVGRDISLKRIDNLPVRYLIRRTFRDLWFPFGVLSKADTGDLSIRHSSDYDFQHGQYRRGSVGERKDVVRVKGEGLDVVPTSNSEKTHQTHSAYLIRTFFGHIKPAVLPTIRHLQGELATRAEYAILDTPDEVVTGPGGTPKKKLPTRRKRIERLSKQFLIPTIDYGRRMDARGIDLTNKRSQTTYLKRNRRGGWELKMTDRLKHLLEKEIQLENPRVLDIIDERLVKFLDLDKMIGRTGVRKDFEKLDPLDLTLHETALKNYRNRGTSLKRVRNTRGLGTVLVRRHVPISPHLIRQQQRRQFPKYRGYDISDAMISGGLGQYLDFIIPLIIDSLLVGLEGAVNVVERKGGVRPGPSDVNYSRIILEYWKKNHILDFGVEMFMWEGNPGVPLRERG